MAITIFGGNGALTTGAGNKAVTITPLQTGPLYVLAAVCVAGTGTFGLTDNNPDGLGTYTKIVDFFDNAGATQITLFVRDALIANTSATTVTTSGFPGGNTGGGVTGVEVHGMTNASAAAIRQSAVASNSPSGSAPSATLATRMLAGNTALGWSVAEGSVNVTPPAQMNNSYGNVNLSTTYSSRTSSLIAGSGGSTFLWLTAPAAANAAAVVELAVVSPALIANPDLSMFPKGGNW